MAEARSTLEWITPAEFREAADLEDWRVIGDGACTVFRTGSFRSGVDLVRAISELPGIDDHLPDVDLRDGDVTVRLITASAEGFGMSTRDVEVAQRITAIARRLGAAADTSNLQSWNITIDALVIPDVKPFWRAVLGYVDRPDNPDEDLVDQRRRGPSVWFQQMDTPRPQRNRVHIDIWVPLDQAEARVAAAIAAGGRLVTDQFAPSWWVLADAEGNEACVASVMGRD